MKFRPLAVLFLLLSTTLAALGGGSWPGENNDFSRRASDPESEIQGDIKESWSKHIVGLEPWAHNANEPHFGIVNRDLCIQNGLLVTVVGSDEPETRIVNGGKDGRGYRCKFSFLRLIDGGEAATRFSNHRYSGDAISTQGGVWDTSNKGSRFHMAWTAYSNYILTIHGGDLGHRGIGDAFTGEIRPEFPSFSLGGGSNASGELNIDSVTGKYVANPNNTHSAYADKMMKHYTGNVVGADGELWKITHFAKTKATFQDTGSGSVITVTRPVAPLTQTISRQFDDFIGMGMQHANGAPRPICLGTDRYYWAGFKNKPSTDPLATTATVLSPDPAGMVRLYGIDRKTGVLDLDVSLGFWPTPFTPTSVQGQLATIPGFTVYYHPGQAGNYTGRVACVNTTTKQLLWSKPITLKTLVNASYRSYIYEQATQLAMDSKAAWIADVYSENNRITLKITRFDLLTGSDKTYIIAPTSYGNVDPLKLRGKPVLNEFAFVNDRGILYGTVNETEAFYFVFEGTATRTPTFKPNAVIAAPSERPLLYKTFPTRPVNQFDTGQEVSFSSAGSNDPNGLPLTYLWDFGDGATSTERNPKHTYATWAGATQLEVRDFTFKLTVNGVTTSRVVKIRNVGKWVLTYRDPAWLKVYPGNVSVTSGPKARNYMGFDLPDNAVECVVELPGGTFGGANSNDQLYTSPPTPPGSTLPPIETAIVTYNIGSPNACRAVFDFDITDYARANPGRRGFMVLRRDEAAHWGSTYYSMNKVKLRYYVDPDGPPSTQPDPGTEPPPPPPPPGTVSIDATKPDVSTPANGTSWTATARGVEALPNSGVAVTTPTGAHNGYKVNFPAAGTYYIYAYAFGANTGDDSIFVGVDGQSAAYPMALGTGTSPKWASSFYPTSNGRAKINVATAGEHVVDLWMREDGAVVNRLFFATDPSTPPQ